MIGQQPTPEGIKRAGIMVTRRELLVTKFLSTGQFKIPEWASSKSHVYTTFQNDFYVVKKADSIERIIIEIYCSISSYFINKEPRSRY
jgi:hypothetical protein